MEIKFDRKKPKDDEIWKTKLKKNDHKQNK
jgi:hypothetical protein